MSTTYFKQDASLETQWELDELLQDMKFPRWIPAADYSRNVIELYKAWPMNLPMLKKLQRGLRVSNGRRTLHVTFGVALKRAKGNVEVDLSSLEHIGLQLDQLVVDVMCVEHGSPLRAQDLQPRMKAEIERLGRVLIGQQTTSRFRSRAHYAAVIGVHWTFEVARV